MEMLQNQQSNQTFYFHKAVDKVKSQCTNHYHNSFEIYYLKSGSCNYFIDNRSYEVKAGDLVLIPEGIIHKTNYGTKTHTRMLINCSMHYVPKSVLPSMPSMIYLYRNPDIIKEAEIIFAKIAEEFERNDKYRDEILRCLSFELFFLLARNINKCAEVNSGSLFIEETVKHIQKNYMNEINLSDMARTHSVSPEHLSRTFKKETGFGFSEYITLVRLQKAEYMLKNEPGKSVCEVAYACGFNDSNYFSDKFKRAYGVAPSKLKIKLSHAARHGGGAK
jgi:AraC-like DNA-binding protein